MSSGTGHRASRARHSETDAWETVKLLAREIASQGSLSRTGVVRRAQEIVGQCETMLAQLARGEHENPPLTVFSLVNPPKRGAQLMSDRLYTIEYRHKTNGKDYFHDFRKGTQMLALSSGDILIRCPGRTMWKDLPGA